MQWDQVKPWRRSERARLSDHREKLGAERRSEMDRALRAHLERCLALLPAPIIGYCWPFRGECDVRPVILERLAHQASAALPVVLDKEKALIFRRWEPGVAMARGVYGILYPSETETVTPDAVLAPLNGFDELGYRLGYGGGYFDRTLAGLAPQPIAIGVGYELLRLKTIYPQPHDVPMDLIATDEGMFQTNGTKLVPIAEDALATVIGQLWRMRRAALRAAFSAE